MDEERACRETALSSGPSADGLILLVVVTPSLVSFAGSFGQTHGQNPQDLPELFMGKPRPYSVHDIEKGMQVRVTNSFVGRGPQPFLPLPFFPVGFQIIGRQCLPVVEERKRRKRGIAQRSGNGRPTWTMQQMTWVAFGLFVSITSKRPRLQMLATHL